MNYLSFLCPLVPYLWMYIKTNHTMLLYWKPCNDVSSLFDNSASHIFLNWLFYLLNVNMDAILIFSIKHISRQMAWLQGKWEELCQRMLLFRNIEQSTLSCGWEIHMNRKASSFLSLKPWIFQFGGFNNALPKTQPKRDKKTRRKADKLFKDCLSGSCWRIYTRLVSELHWWEHTSHTSCSKYYLIWFPARYFKQSPNATEKRVELSYNQYMPCCSWIPNTSARGLYTTILLWNPLIMQ